MLPPSPGRSGRGWRDESIPRLRAAPCRRRRRRGTRVPIPCPRPRRQPPAPRLRLQLKLTPNVALMSGLHLISPAPGKEGPAGLEKDHTWQLLIETRPPVTGGSSFLLKRLLITNEPCLCFGCDVPLRSPAPPPAAPHPGWRQRSGGSGGGGSCRVGTRGAVRTRFLQRWIQGWLENGSLQLLSPPFPFSMKDNSFGGVHSVKPEELKLWDHS